MLLEPDRSQTLMGHTIGWLKSGSTGRPPTSPRQVVSGVGYLENPVEHRMRLSDLADHKPMSASQVASISTDFIHLPLREVSIHFIHHWPSIGFGGGHSFRLEEPDWLVRSGSIMLDRILGPDLFGVEASTTTENIPKCLLSKSLFFRVRILRAAKGSWTQILWRDSPNPWV